MGGRPGSYISTHTKSALIFVCFRHLLKYRTKFHCVLSQMGDDLMKILTLYNNFYLWHPFLLTELKKKQHHKLQHKVWDISTTRIYVMRSSKMSLTKCVFMFIVYMPQHQNYHTENPLKIKHMVTEIAILVMLKTIKYKQNLMLLLASDSFCLITSHMV